jgi:hypothetical protein
MDPNHLLLAGVLLVSSIVWFLAWEWVRARRERGRETKDELTWWLSKGGLLLLSMAAFAVLLLGRR